MAPCIGAQKDVDGKTSFNQSVNRKLKHGSQLQNVSNKTYFLIRNSIKH